MRTCEGTPHLLRVLWIFSRWGMSESLSAMSTAQQPRARPHRCRLAIIRWGVGSTERENSNFWPVTRSYTEMYRYALSTTCSSVSFGTALPGLNPCSSSRSRTYCLEYSLIFNSGFLARSSITFLYDPAFISASILGTFSVHSLMSHNREESGVLISSITYSFPLSSVPNSYFVSMNMRPRAAANSAPRWYNFIAVSFSCFPNDSPTNAITSSIVMFSSCAPCSAFVVGVNSGSLNLWKRYRPSSTFSPQNTRSPFS
mmetsp:Transcript_53536/g.88204  ORF Transcript_53536/g.88204 Transcript_53536/m.88204 type:complete len:257 (-) Transcript_53536:411-1181(-)